MALVVEAQIEFPILLTEFWASVPADQGFGSVGATKLNEELADKEPFLLDVRETAEVELGFKRFQADLLGNPPEANRNRTCLPVKQTPDKLCCSYLVSVRLKLAALAQRWTMPVSDSKAQGFLCQTILPGKD